jgi:ribosomal protein L40E
MKGMKDSEYKSCIDNLGLLEGEEIKFQLVCFRQTVGATSIWSGERETKSRKGLLVFTTDNMIFMQQEGAWSSDYSQALRFSLEEISGVSSESGFTQRLRILIGAKGNSEYHDFLPFRGQGDIKEIRSSIMGILQEVREEKKRLAQEALAKGTVPTMIFCKYCGARNKSEQSQCVKCGATLA